MTTFKFIYKTPKGKIRNDISIEAPDYESAIAYFETDFPNCKFYQTEETLTTKTKTNDTKGA